MTENINASSTGKGRLVLSALLALLIFFGINLNLGEFPDNSSLSQKIIGALQTSPDENAILLIEAALITLLVFWFLRKMNIQRPRVSTVFASLFFGFAMTFGGACENFSDPTAIIRGPFDILIALFALLAYSALAYFAFELLFSICDRLNRHRFNESTSNSMLLFFDKKPFASVFAIMGIAWLPFLIAFFPGLFAPGDTLNQICQFYNLPEATSSSIIPINPEILLNEHHPVVHTVLMGISTQLGITLFASCNIGYFFYILLQFLCVIATLSYGVSFLKRYGVSIYVRLALTGFLTFMPWFCEYALLGTKDTLFACSLLLLCLSLIKLGTNYKMRKSDWLLLAISILGFCLLKKSYIVLALIIFLVAAFKTARLHRPKLVQTFTITLTFVILIQNVIFPTMQISPGSPREMLSIPVQQTARCVMLHENELSEAQKESISKVFDYSKMKTAYNPYLSDPIKNTFNKYATKDDLKDYLVTWGTLVTEFPDTCISATLMNYYGYFYPTTAEKYDYDLASSRSSIYAINNDLSFCHLDNPYTNLLGKLFTFGQDFWNSVPIFSLFSQGSTYVWILLFLSLYWFQRKHFARFSVLPVILVLLITMIGPCNFIVRYIFPIAFVIPFLGLMMFSKTPPRKMSRQ